MTMTSFAITLYG